jgi:hypothetical protein
VTLHLSWPTRGVYVLAAVVIIFSSVHQIGYIDTARHQLTDTDAEPVDRQSRQARGTRAHRDLMSDTARAHQHVGKLPMWA